MRETLHMLSESHSAEENHKTFLAYVPGEQFSFEWVAVVIIHLWYRPFFSANILVINASCQCWCSLHLFGSVLVDHTLDWLFFSGLHSLCFLLRFSRYIADWIQSFEPIHTSSVHCYKWVGCLYEYLLPIDQFLCCEGSFLPLLTETVKIHPGVTESSNHCGCCH